MADDTTEQRLRDIEELLGYLQRGLKELQTFVMKKELLKCVENEREEKSRE